MTGMSQCGVIIKHRSTWLWKRETYTEWCWLTSCMMTEVNVTTLKILVGWQTRFTLNFCLNGSISTVTTSTSYASTLNKILQHIY